MQLGQSTTRTENRSFFDLELSRQYLEDLSRRHERFPYKLSKIAKAGQSVFHEIKEAQSRKALDTLWHRVKGRFVQEDCVDFNLHDYMLSLYDVDMRECHYFPALDRTELEPIKVGSELEGRVQFLDVGRNCTREHLLEVNEKPKHLREFSGKFMEVFRSLYVGNGFRHLSDHINFFEEYPGTHFQDDAFVFNEDREKKFLESVTSVTYVGKRKVPTIPQTARNWFFTNGWSPVHPAFRMEFTSRPPATAYLANTICGEAYEEGELLVVM